MIRSLRKTRPEGPPYTRREVVTTEINALSALEASELESRAAVSQSSSPRRVSSEALLYYVRTTAEGVHRDKLSELLLGRLALGALTGSPSSITVQNIQADVVSHFVDLLLSDREDYDQRLDYYEVNFNATVRFDRLDASKRHWKHENRTEALGTEDAEISDHVEAAAGSTDPFDPDELDKKNYRLRLDDAIDNLPQLQRRIVVMLREEIPIESIDPLVKSISEVLGKTPKTIAKYRDMAYASLRRRLEQKERR